MNLKKNSVTFILLLLVFASAAQQDSYKYSFVDHNPYNANNASLLVYAGLDFSTRTAPVGLQLNYMLGRVSLEGKFARSVLDFIASERAKNDSIGLHPFNFVELTGAIHLVDKYKKGTSRYILSQSSSYSGSTYTRYLPIPVCYRKIFGIRMGLQHFNTYGEQKVYDDNKKYIRTDNHNVNVTNLYAGFLFKKVRDFRVGVAGFEKTKSIRQMREMYIDILFAPSIQIDPMVAGKSMSVDQIKTRNIGFRMGWQWRSCRIFGGNLRIEFGLLPGVIIPKSDLYTLMTYGFNFSTFAGKKKEKIVTCE